MRWMEIAWAEQGTAEIAGPDSNPKILDYFRKSGHAAVTSEATAWCGAFAGACLGGAGLPVPPLEQRLRARAYLEVGTPIDTPRVGAIVVFKRGDDPLAGHVGFVTGWTETHIACLGGNQGDAVTVAHFPRAEVVGYRWPEPPSSASDLAGLGSRIVLKGRALVGDGYRALGVAATGVAAQATDPDKLAAPAKKAVSGLGDVMSVTETVQRFGHFALKQWPWIAAVLCGWWLLRIVAGAGGIVAARVEDHNTGANPTRRADDAA